MFLDQFAMMNLYWPAGKTLVARALASHASRYGGRKVSFYMRKGADVLSKWVGEAERQLRLLFEEAQKNAPSIIFFDEIDGLAPVRRPGMHPHAELLCKKKNANPAGIGTPRGPLILVYSCNGSDVACRRCTYGQVCSSATGAPCTAQATCIVCNAGPWIATCSTVILL